MNNIILYIIHSHPNEKSNMLCCAFYYCNENLYMAVPDVFDIYGVKF